MTRSEAKNSSWERFDGLGMPNPPSLTGRAKRSRSVSLGGDLPVMAGISFALIADSKGAK